MRPASLLPLLASIAYAQTPAPTNASGCPDSIGTDDHDLSGSFRQLRAPARNDRHAQFIDRMEKRGTGQSFVPMSTQNGMCLDVKDNRMQNGAGLQLWQCSGGGNQQWRIEGPLLQTNQDLCADIPNGVGYNGAPVQVYKCDGQNKNQLFDQIGSSLQWRGSPYCLDVKDGSFANGGQIQLWTCYPGSANQAFVLGQAQSQGTAPQGSSASTGATNFYGYNCISLDDFVRKYPVCAPYKGALQSAGADQGINPVFLGAIAMIESNCGEGLKNSPNAWAGPFQFMDDSATRFYVGAPPRDRTNFWDAAYGAARYFKALLAQTNGNLYQAMRNYNGDPANGGETHYQEWAAGFMGGYR